MYIRITYVEPAAGGEWRKNSAIVETSGEADHFCELVLQDGGMVMDVERMEA